MKQKRRLFVLLLALLIIGSAVPAQAAKIKLNKKSAKVYVGKTVNLKVKGTSKKVKWSTSDSTIATVTKKGKVKGVKVGKATITAKVGKKNLKCKVTVSKKPLTHNQKFTFKVSNPLTLTIGETKTVPVACDGFALKWNWTGTAITTQAGGWTEGNVYNIKVTGNKEGTSKLTVRDEEVSSVSAALTVNVVPPALKISLPSLPQTIDYYSGTTLKSSCKVEKIEIKQNYYTSSKKYYVQMYLTLTKTYDKTPSVSSACRVGYKLYDEEDIVIESGTFLSDSVFPGEKCKGSKYLSTNLMPGKYRLELLNVV